MSKKAIFYYFCKTDVLSVDVLLRVCVSIDLNHFQCQLASKLSQWFVKVELYSFVFVARGMFATEFRQTDRLDGSV